MRFHFIIAIVINLAAAMLSLTAVYRAYGFTGLLLLLALSVVAGINAYFQTKAVYKTLGLTEN